MAGPRLSMLKERGAFSFPVDKESRTLYSVSVIQTLAPTNTYKQNKLLSTEVCIFTKELEATQNELQNDLMFYNKHPTPAVLAHNIPSPRFEQTSNNLPGLNTPIY